ncbi:unnamed protein product, partial [Discosporangium mesarthrocarpum]
VDGLQRSVGELEGEALRWQAALDEARLRLATEEEAGRLAGQQREEEQRALESAVSALREEARRWEARIEGLRECHHQADDSLAGQRRSLEKEFGAMKSRLGAVEAAVLAKRGELEG